MTTRTNHIYNIWDMFEIFKTQESSIKVGDGRKLKSYGFCTIKLKRDCF